MMMDVETYRAIDAWELSRFVRRGACSPSDVISFWKRVANGTSEIGALVEIYDDIATPTGTGPLGGVPIVRKDLDAVENGRLTEWCSPLGRGRLGSTTSNFLKLLTSAGAVVTGRATTPELGSSITTESLLYGPTRNPFAPDFNAGGSSGGSAALVAVGAVPIAHGSDAAGSLRIPASWCGVYTMKPARGRISQEPDGPNLFGLSENFVLTRSVRDLRTCYRLLEQPVRGEFYDFSHSPRSEFQVRRLRVGFIDYPIGRGPLDGEYAEAVRKIASECKQLGFHVERVKFNFNFEEYVDFILIRFSYTLAWHASSLGCNATSKQLDSIHPVVKAWQDYGLNLPARAIYDALELQNSICRSVGSVLDEYDVVLMPVTAQTPTLNGAMLPHRIDASAIPELNAAYEEHVQYCGITNISGHPSVVIPYGFHSNGTPFGIQIAGGRNATETIIDLAEVLSQNDFNEERNVRVQNSWPCI